MTRSIELQAIRHFHSLIVYRDLALLQLIVGLGFYTMVSATDGLLMEHNYLPVYHPSHEYRRGLNICTILIFISFILA